MNLSIAAIEFRVVLLHVCRPILPPEFLDHGFHGFGTSHEKARNVAVMLRTSIRIDTFEAHSSTANSGNLREHPVVVQFGDWETAE
jgi:hypothetical protein